MSTNTLKLSTKLIHLQSEPRKTVNPPLERGSTITTGDLDELYGKTSFYGRHGHATHTELAQGLCLLEAAAGCFLTQNGISACTNAIEALAPVGSHILYLDSLYGPTSRYLAAKTDAGVWSKDSFNARASIDQVERLIKPNTSLMVLEAPGSLTFEIPDLPALAALAKAHNIKIMVDNTWGAGYFYKPLTLGADVSVQALTKYVCGHADALGGAVLSRTPETAAHIDRAMRLTGPALSPDDAYLHLRGLRTLPLRIKAHEANAWCVADWLASQTDTIHTVLHPALPSFPDHALWKRDFSGACGLFGLVLRASPCGDNDRGIRRLISALSLFKMGFSWGGFESLLMPCDPQLKRPDNHWTNDITQKPGPLIRIHIGQEDSGDLIAELTQALAHYNAV